MKNIHQAAMNAKGEHPKKTNALDREESCEIADGFNVKVNGDVLTIVYQISDRVNNTLDKKKYTQKMEKHMSDLKSYMKKEYKDLTSKSLGLKDLDKVDIFIQPLNATLCVTTVTQNFKISSLDKLSDEDTDKNETLKEARDRWKSYLGE